MQQTQNNQWLQQQVDQHFSYQTQIAQYEEVVNKLKTDAAKVYTEIFDYIDTIDKKSVELPACHVFIKREKEVKVGKNATKWQQVFTKINDIWDLPQKEIQKIIDKLTTPAKTTVTYNNTLLIEKK